MLQEKINMEKKKNFKGWKWIRNPSTNIKIYCQDIELELWIEKCVTSIMKKGKRKIIYKIKQANQLSIKVVREKKLQTP